MRRKRDPSKLGIAVRLRKETTLSVKEIAARLHLGTPGNASVCLLAALNKAQPGNPYTRAAWRDQSARARQEKAGLGGARTRWLTERTASAQAMARRSRL